MIDFDSFEISKSENRKSKNIKTAFGKKGYVAKEVEKNYRQGTNAENEEYPIISSFQKDILCIIEGIPSNFEDLRKFRMTIKME